MLQKIKFETVNFGNYDKLKKKFNSSDFDPLEIIELELSYQKATSFPNDKCLSMMTNLTTLILSNNKINRFDAFSFVKSVPQLEALDVSNNLINIMDDLRDLGSLNNLKILEFSFNPVCTHMQRIAIIKELFYPKKYQKYDPVKILTASYNYCPNIRLSKVEEEQLK